MCWRSDLQPGFDKVATSIEGDVFSEAEMRFRRNTYAHKAHLSA
jgi:hypothetical protein